MASLLTTAKECGRIQPDSTMDPSETFLWICPMQASKIIFQIHTHRCHIKEMDIFMRKQGFPIPGSASGIGINQT